MNLIDLFILYLWQPGALKLNESPNGTKPGYFSTEVAKTMVVVLVDMKWVSAAVLIVVHDQRPMLQNTA